MSLTNNIKMNNWDKNTYQRIENVILLKDSIEVLFENGDETKVSLKSVLPISFDEHKLEMDFNSYEVLLKNVEEIVAIPWSKIRVLTDLEYSRYMVDQAEEQAKEIGKKIKGLRERKGIKSNELAERSGLTAQTISRIERGHTDVSFATLKKMLAAMGLTLKELADYQLEEQVSPERSLNYLLRRLSQAGIDSKFLLNRLIPKRMDLDNLKGDLPPLLLNEIVTYIKTVYNWSNELIWSNEELSIDDNASKLAFYKKPVNSNLYQIKAYSHYAYYISKLVLQSTNSLVKKDYPGDTNEFRKLFKKSQIIDFESCLSLVWDLGICVMPLRDKGLFHGASWNIEGRHIIILKQTSNSQAKWLFDLLHELYHVFAHLDDANTSVIETEEISQATDQSAVEEAEANSFAHKVLFDDSTESIVSKCLSLANYKIENLRNAVNMVSQEENIGADIIANYLAYRLSLQNENWWSTANSLQVTNPDPYDIAIKYLKENLEDNINNPIEANLLTMAINN